MLDNSSFIKILKESESLESLFYTWENLPKVTWFVNVGLEFKQGFKTILELGFKTVLSSKRIRTYLKPVSVFIQWTVPCMLSHHHGGREVGTGNIPVYTAGKNPCPPPANIPAVFCWYLYSGPLLLAISGCHLVDNWHWIRSFPSKSSAQHFTKVINFVFIIGAYPYSSSHRLITRI